MSAAATSSTPGTRRAVLVSPCPMPPAPRRAMRMRSLGATGFASWAARAAADGPRTVVAPASFRNWRRVGCLEVDMAILLDEREPRPPRRARQSARGASGNLDGQLEQRRVLLRSMDLVGRGLVVGVLGFEDVGHV